MAARRAGPVNDMVRQNVRQQLKEVLDQVPIPTKSAEEVESKIFNLTHNDIELYVHNVKGFIAKIRNYTQKQLWTRPTMQLQQRPASKVPEITAGEVGEMVRYGGSPVSPQYIRKRNLLSTCGNIGCSNADCLLTPSPSLLLHSEQAIMQRPTRLQRSQTFPTSPQEEHMCQPLLDAIASNVDATMVNHTLKRTFGPALESMDSSYPVPEGLCCKRLQRRDSSEEEDYQPGIKVPDIVQMEVAGLGSIFKVTVDLFRSSNPGTLHLICRLEDSSLPPVPPIRLFVPSTYPKEGAEWKCWNAESEREDAALISKALLKPTYLDIFNPKVKEENKNIVDRKETISAILTAWRSSVKQKFVSNKRTSA